jgi:anti-sigma regulatory factor (Ser/Thr protein kinase)
VAVGELLLDRTLPAEAPTVPLVRRDVARVLVELALSRDRAADVLLALTEACTNVVVHAYRDAPGSVRVSLMLGDALVIEVQDYGAGMRAWDETRATGLGLPLIAAMSDALQLTSNADGGTCVRMTFALDGS